MPHCVAARARIHYEVDGEGEPLVLVAGTAFDMSFWDDLLPQLRGFRVLRLDNRGAGLSDAPDEAFSIEQMADDVAAVMDAAGMPSAHVYGMSMGGLIAQDLAIRYPERVLSLVLGATYAGGPPLSRAVRLLPLLLSEKGPEDLLRATAPFLSATPIPATADRFPGHGRAPRNKRALRRQLAAQMRYSSMRRLHMIQQPTLVMHGEKDRLISPLNARRMTRRIPVRGSGLSIFCCSMICSGFATRGMTSQTSPLTRGADVSPRWSTPPIWAARLRPCMSLRTRTGSTRPASRCWRIFCRWWPGLTRLCWSHIGPNFGEPCDTFPAHKPFFLHRWMIRRP